MAIALTSALLTAIGGLLALRRWRAARRERDTTARIKRRYLSV